MWLGLLYYFITFHFLILFRLFRDSGSMVEDKPGVANADVSSNVSLFREERVDFTGVCSVSLSNLRLIRFSACDAPVSTVDVLLAGEAAKSSSRLINAAVVGFTSFSSDDDDESPVATVAAIISLFTFARSAAAVDLVDNGMMGTSVPLSSSDDDVAGFSFLMIMGGGTSASEPESSDADEALALQLASTADLDWRSSL